MILFLIGAIILQPLLIAIFFDWDELRDWYRYWFK